MANAFTNRVLRSLKKRDLLTMNVFEEVMYKKDNEIKLCSYLVNNGFFITFMDVMAETNNSTLFWCVMLDILGENSDEKQSEWKFHEKISESLCRIIEAKRRRDILERAKVCTVSLIDTD